MSFEHDPALRPRSFDEFVGQKRVLDNLRVYVRAALDRGEALDHVLLAGPPGLGKTTLAHIVAEELGVELKTASGPTLERGADLAAILTQLNEREVLFIDEIHRLHRAVEEVLYPAMEDYELDILIGQGPGAQSVKVPVPPFTLVGATTRSGLLTRPLRARFGIPCQMDYYEPDELQTIVERSGRCLELPLDRDAAAALARRSRGTPRIANRLLKRVRDFAQVMGDGRATLAMVELCLEREGVDGIGLDGMDLRVLHTIGFKFDGGPVGLTNLAAAIGEQADTIEETYEPYLIRQGLLQRTPRGRVLTTAGAKHVGWSAGEVGSTAPELPQEELF